MLNKALEYLLALFVRLAERDYHLHELEATAFLPYLVIKVSTCQGFHFIFKKRAKMFSQAAENVKFS